MEPWLAELRSGDSHVAWNLFQDRYRNLMLATIRRLIADRDDLMDVFASCCEGLALDDFARLRRYSDTDASRASAATWVVAVVRNITIDWLRARDGRPRHAVPPHLTPLHQAIYAVVCIQGYPYRDAYERIRDRADAPASFPAFLREVRAIHLTAPCPRAVTSRRAAPAAPPPAVDSSTRDPAESAELAQRLEAALADCPPDLRLALELFVVERMPAAEVARLVGWPNAKAVYNRVSRTLAQLRARFQKEGLSAVDF